MVYPWCTEQWQEDAGEEEAATPTGALSAAGAGAGVGEMPQETPSELFDKATASEANAGVALPGLGARSPSKSP